ncbi:hypothetical protein GWK47_013450 [Chionoecetes opilio]|uniref:Uncharacterized protein n=1 Tax=Chionoecetes opilio TaxID=41210 RepID=A0A8J4XXX7_CHIOP|nr:hypothetical protein GWK47_013450 [Chionoecetes opilio]
MARMKTMTKYNAAQHFMTLHKKHRDLARNKGRTGDPGGKRSAFVLELDSLFDIGASDAIQEIERNRLLSREKKDKDIRFYQDQKTERKAHMSGHDKIFESRSQQQAERAARLQQREEQDINFCHKISTIFQLPHSEGLLLMCLPGLTQPTVKGMQRTWITNNLVLDVHITKTL